MGRLGSEGGIPALVGGANLLQPYLGPPPIVQLDHKRDGGKACEQGFLSSLTIRNITNH